VHGPVSSSSSSSSGLVMLQLSASQGFALAHRGLCLAVSGLRSVELSWTLKLQNKGPK
jgi:hypothetical protein